jgi:phenylpropionate dioxygenase-like ring-hydroxylating dioxygenase large terminal subunit
MSVELAEKASEKPIIQTLDMLSEDQVSAIRRILSHDQARVPVIEATKPVSMFISEERYDREQAQLFKKQAVPVTLSALIKEPGSAVAHDGYGIPLILTRDREGVVHAFLNVCQHKGAKLLEHCNPVKGGRLTCPYHAWTFGLDGKLLAAARSETFEGLDKSTRGLAELPARESGGFIWVMLDRDAEPDFSSLDDQLALDMDALGIPDAHVYGRQTFDLQANWKLVLEPFLEGYHVQRLHAASIGNLFADVPNVVDELGPNIRQISGKLNFTPDCLDIPGENIHKSVTHAYNIFPNGVVVTSPYYISVMILMPRAVNRTVVELFNLTRVAPDNPKAEELYKRSYEMVLNVFGNEDFRAAQISQEGLESGAMKDVVYSGLEATIPQYYDILDRYVPA